MDTLKTDVLYYGDNLEILRRHIPDDSIDLVYLDPPFNSRKDYNVLFKEDGGVESEAQIRAFTDTWLWTQSAENTYHDIVTNGPLKVGQLIGALHDAIGRNDVMAYLVMMTARLIELHRVLKPTGSLYLHCDPTASHYLKLVLDQVFGPTNFLNEVVWCYGERELSKRYWNRKHDVLLFYAKDAQKPYHFNSESLMEAYSPITLSKFRYEDEHGRFMVRGKNIKGSPIQRADGLTLEHEKMYPGLTYRKYLGEGTLPRDWWEVKIINKAAKERLGYPTQKPVALLERIIKASSNESDVVLDPFCGCGTALVAAQKLNRRWIGIDITHLAIALMRNRLKDSFSIDAEVIGEPVDLAGAKALARHDRYQFQWWALSLIRARPVGDKKKGADKGIDGVIQFIDDATGKPKRALVQVKSGNVGVNAVRELTAVAAHDALGILITLEPPTGPMQTEAVSAGFYHSPGWDRDYPKIQILTIDELLHGRTVDMPPQTQTNVTFAKAPKVSRSEGEQLTTGI